MLDSQTIFDRSKSNNYAPLTLEEIEYLQSIGMVPVGPTSKGVDCEAYFLSFVNNKFGVNFGLEESKILRNAINEGEIIISRALPEDFQPNEYGIFYYSYCVINYEYGESFYNFTHVGIVTKLKGRKPPLVLSKLFHYNLFLHTPDHEIVMKRYAPYVDNEDDLTMTSGFLYFKISDFIKLVETTSLSS